MLNHIQTHLMILQNMQVLLIYSEKVRNILEKLYYIRF